MIFYPYELNRLFHGISKHIPLKNSGLEDDPWTIFLLIPGPFPGDISFDYSGGGTHDSRPYRLPPATARLSTTSVP